MRKLLDECLSDPSQFRETTMDFPADWKYRNLVGDMSSREDSALCCIWLSHFHIGRLIELA